MRRIAAAVLAISIGIPMQAQAPREVEFQFNYRPAAFDALARDIDNVSLVVPEWFFVDSTGALTGEVEPRLLDLARKHNVPVMPQVKNYDRKTGLFSAAWAHGLVSEKASRQRAIAKFLELCRTHRLYGIQVELEGVHISDRDSLSQFIREAATALHKEGYKLSVSAIHREEDAPGPNSYTQWMYEYWRGAYDLKALGQAADFVRAVVYAQHTRRTPPGPSQNVPWLERVMAHFVASIPPEKIIIGLGMGAQRWFTVADPKLYYQGARSWSQGIRRADIPPLLAQFHAPPMMWDDRQKMSFSYLERAGAFEWIVSDNDVRAFDAKLELARKLGVRGVSMWVNGDEEPGIWARFRPKSLSASRREAPAYMGGIPVFLWHYFADSLTSNTGSLTETYSRFETFLAFLKEQGYQSVFPEDSRVPGLGGGKQVILTFDDGRNDQIRAAQILDKYGFKGIFFIVPNRTSSRSEVYLTREEIGRIAKAGHRIAVHGYEHRSLASSGSESGSATQKAFELLTDSSGVRPSQVEFAMPFGHYTDDVIDNLESRYRYLMSVNPGYWDGAGVMVPRMLVFRDTPLDYYKEYVQAAGDYAPVLVPITADGAVTDTVAFRIEASPLPDKIEMLAVSADSSGRPYSTHPVGDAARVRASTLVLDLKKMRDRYFGPGRNVIGYALVYHGAKGLRYLTPGVMHWLSDPATGPLLRP